MPTDTSEFTLSLFDNTALSGWTHHTPPSRRGPGRSRCDDADDDDEGRRHAAACGRSGRARQQLPSRRRPRACPRLARAGARQHRRDHPVEGAGAIGPRTDRGRAGATAALHRLWRDGTGAELLPPPRRGRIPARTGRRSARRSKPPSRRRNTPPCNAPRSTPTTRRRRSSVALWRAAERLGFTGGRVLEPGMGTGLFFALLPEALRDDLPAHRHRIRSGHRPHRAPRASRGAGAVRGLHAQQSDRTLRPRDRQSALLRSRGAGRSRHARPRAAAARLLHRPLDRAAAPRRDRAVRHQHRHDGQGQHRRRGNTSPAWPIWWARCVCPRAACARARAPMW